jgi:ABC-type multidrug transport system fused ATPase/permease subunit
MVKDQPSAEKFTIQKGKIEIKNVTFGYPVHDGNSFRVFNNFSLTIPERSRTAIVGRSGCGKTTLFNLILRFFDPDSGEIMIDGKNIRSMDQKFLRFQIGLVMQETLLLNGTIRDNMQFVSGNANDAQIIQALKDAQIWDYFNHHGNGLDSIIGERGVRLSGGQRQRISIARILLKNPSIVLLDEVTASMDADTEKNIMESIEKLLHGRTSIIISHRLATIQSCDEIIVIDKGIVLDKGTHLDLYNRCELYHSLCTNQDLIMEKSKA